MSQTLIAAFAVVGIDIGKNSFHIVDHDERGAIALRQKWSRGQVEARFANMPPCLIGMEACVGAHHLSRKLRALGHDARLTRDFRCRPIFDFATVSLQERTSGDHCGMSVSCQFQPRATLPPTQAVVYERFAAGMCR